MSITLEKIDLIRERLDVSIREAKEALEATGGDVVEALVRLENQGRPWEETLQTKGHQIMTQLKGLFQKGNVTKVRLKRDGETVYEFPATVGALGLLGVLASTELAILTGVGTVAAMLNRYSLELEKASGEVENHPLQQGH